MRVLLAKQGPQGVAGVNWRFSYDPNASYAVNDGVFADNGSFRCIRSIQGIAPTGELSDPYWFPIALGGGGTGNVAGGDLSGNYPDPEVAFIDHAYQNMGALDEVKTGDLMVVIRNGTSYLATVADVLAASSPGGQFIFSTASNSGIAAGVL